MVINPFGDEGARALAAGLRARGRPRMQRLRYDATYTGRVGEEALADVEVSVMRRAGGPIYNFLFGYVPRQGQPEASSLPFLLSNYKDAYERFPDPPHNLRLGQNS